MSEFLEQMEHAGHSGGHGGHGDDKKSNSKFIGMTMAVLGVLLALCSAMVGGARTELIATMVEQTGTAQLYQAISMKHRTLQAQLQQLHALLPADPKEFEVAEAEIVKTEVGLAKTPNAAVVHALRMEVGKILNTVTPTGTDVLRFVSLVRDYHTEAEAAKEWVESYEDAIKAHFQSSEHYEWAQLCAEFGIVLASIALLLGSKTSWMGSLVLGVASLSIIIVTYTSSHGALKAAEHKIEEAKTHYKTTNQEAKQEKDDEDLLKDIERIEGPIAGAESPHAAAAPHAAEAPHPAEAPHAAPAHH